MDAEYFSFAWIGTVATIAGQYNAERRTNLWQCVVCQTVVGAAPYPERDCVVCALVALTNNDRIVTG